VIVPETAWLLGRRVIRNFLLVFQEERRIDMKSDVTGHVSNGQPGQTLMEPGGYGIRLISLNGIYDRFYLSIVIYLPHIFMAFSESIKLKENGRKTQICEHLSKQA
jgi:hypothetical protein